MSKARALFDRELTDLRDNILYLGGMVETAIEKAIQALRDQDEDLARQVIAGDEEINARRYDIEEQCVRLIATQQWGRRTRHPAGQSAAPEAAD